VTEAALSSAVRTLDITGEGLKAVRTALGAPPLADAFAAAVALVRGVSGRLIVTGMGKSGHIARKLAATFSSTGTAAYFVHPSEASHGDLGMIDATDVVLALSWSGETPELANLVGYCRRFGVPLIAITAGEGSTLANSADIALVLPRIREACPHGLAPTTSTVLQLVVGDALAIALLEAKGFSARDFGTYHPGGKLGARLRYVRDLMHRGALMPLLPLATPMNEALFEMTAKGFGVVGILDGEGQMTGIITDGDLRRHLGNDLLGQTVDTVMSRNPKVVPPDTLAGEAMELMQSMKITVLFAVEDGRPVGVLHMLDLLRAGVA